MSNLLPSLMPGCECLSSFEELLARIRDIRSSDKEFMSKVLEIFVSPPKWTYNNNPLDNLTRFVKKLA